MNDESKLKLPTKPVDPAVADIEVERFAGLTFHQYGQAIDFCRLISQANSGIPKFLRGNPADCLVVTTQALRWKLEPVWTMQHAYVTKDDSLIAYDAAVHASILLASGKLKGRPRYVYSGEGEERRCKVIATLVTEDEPLEYETPPIKQCRPPKNNEGVIKGSPLWVRDPDQQLGYYAIRNWGRRHMPELMGGVYDRDELEGATQEASNLLAPPPRRPENARTRVSLAPGPNHMKPTEAAPTQTQADPAPTQTKPEANGAPPLNFDPDTGEIFDEPAGEDKPHPYPEADKALNDAAAQGTDSLRTAYRNLDQNERKYFTQEVVAKYYLPAARAADEKNDTLAK